MSTDVLQESSGPPPRDRADGPTDGRNRTSGRWWKLSLFATVVIAVLASASAALIRRTASSQNEGLSQTYTIRRTDLLVTVTEQGTLESSKNTEIKCQIRGGYGGRGGRSMVNWVIPAGSVVGKGDELVRLDTKVIEETVSLGKTDTNIAIAALARAEADLAIAETAVDAYVNGRYVAQVKELQQKKEIAERNLASAQTTLGQTEALFERGYVSKLEVDANEYTVTRAQLELNIADTEIDVLERLTRKMELETLNGQVTATKARLKGRTAGVELEQGRLKLAEEELNNSTIRAPRDGLVIYPSTAKWKDTPDISEGASVHNNQVLLLMPDLSEMQVTVAVHESIVDRVKPGMSVRVTLPTRTLDTKVSSVAAVASPAGWWSGNVVTYDAAIELPPEDGLKPGMSADVEITIARYDNVLTIPAAAVVETGNGVFCWVSAPGGEQRRTLTLGDSNDEFIVVDDGLAEGDEVFLDPVASIADARELVAPTLIHTVQRGDLQVTLTEQATLESSNNTLVKCKVRGASTVNRVIESGNQVKKGDELVRLENKQIEEHIHERTKFAHLSRDAAIGFRAQATVAGLAIRQYLEGAFRTELMTLEKDLAVAEQSLRTAQDLLNHMRSMQERGYKSLLDVEQQQAEFNQAKLAVKIKNTEIDVLQKFTKEEQLITLNGNWEAAKAAANGHEEVLKNDEARIAHAQEELKHCVVTAPRDGLVIYPKGKQWKDEPEIAEGSTVHNDQVLLLMPDLMQMQARVGIHEGIVDDIEPGMTAMVTLPGRTLDGKVTGVAQVTAPKGFWAGNVVKYDAVVKLPSVEGLKPGMTAEVEILMARHENVLVVPLAAVVEADDEAACWVGTPDSARRRTVRLGDSNDEFVVVEDGLEEGEQIVINPANFFEDARTPSPAGATTKAPNP